MDQKSKLDRNWLLGTSWSFTAQAKKTNIYCCVCPQTHLSLRVFSSLSLSMRISFCSVRCWPSASRSSFFRAFSSPLWCVSRRLNSSSYCTIFFSSSVRMRMNSGWWSEPAAALVGPACFNGWKTTKTYRYELKSAHHWVEECSHTFSNTYFTK